MEKKKAKNIGIPGIESPSDVCEDINCPFHGKISVRGRIFRGVVESIKPSKTAIIKWERRVYFPKYERFEKRFTKVNAHRPSCLHIKEGDFVIIGECRPISKTKKFVIIGKVGENERA
ncbi:MAG: 30S ribosomal protein S17 [Nanoarchaeota archaeon]|nr:30S ribosomal protein S17 [Nanoarchaeota archaeon]